EGKAKWKELEDKVSFSKGSLSNYLNNLMEDGYILKGFDGDKKFYEINTDLVSDCPYLSDELAEERAYKINEVVEGMQDYGLIDQFTPEKVNEFLEDYRDHDLVRIRRKDLMGRKQEVSKEAYFEFHRLLEMVLKETEEVRFSWRDVGINGIQKQESDLIRFVTKDDILKALEKG
ncbi:MAG: hypothetical protein MUP63_00005, partial [Candidatus Nanohaloarchaeota archaeon QJJ-7]|nr:hypothetical protein [Candidatus Nanohaloarchaeota archaeon QJJ-7]